MRVNKILRAQSVRFTAVLSASGGTLSASSTVNAIKAIRDRYNFLKYPRELADINNGNGLLFISGNFEEYYIERFGVFGNGLALETFSNTNVSDYILDDIQSFLGANELASFEVSGPLFYDSIMEVEFSAGLAKLFTPLLPFGSTIAEQLRSYGQTVPDLVPTGIALGAQYDRGFRLEAREGSPGLLYSAAPLRTDDHKSVLEQIEQALAAA